MINEEKVKELYKMAIYDNTKEKKCQQMGHYFRSDYVAKELIKSVFSGTIAFVLIVIIWEMNRMTEFMAEINHMDLMSFGTNLILIYIAFMSIYLLITYVVYSIRYTNGRKELKNYTSHLKKINKMYEQDDKREN